MSNQNAVHFHVGDYVTATRDRHETVEGQITEMRWAYPIEDKDPHALVSVNGLWFLESQLYHSLESKKAYRPADTNNFVNTQATNSPIPEVYKSTEHILREIKENEQLCTENQARLEAEEDKVQRWRRHLEICYQCQDRRFDLCLLGEEILASPLPSMRASRSSVTPATKTNPDHFRSS